MTDLNDLPQETIIALKKHFDGFAPLEPLTSDDVESYLEGECFKCALDGKFYPWGLGEDASDGERVNSLNIDQYEEEIGSGFDTYADDLATYRTAIGY